MRHLCLLLGVIGWASSQEVKTLIDILGEIRGADAPPRQLKYIRSHPMDEEENKLEDVLDDLNAEKQAISMLDPSKAPELLEDFKSHLESIKDVARMLRPATRSLRRNMESPRGVSQQVDTLLNIIKTALTNAADTVERLIPNAAPLTRFLKSMIVNLFG